MRTTALAIALLLSGAAVAQTTNTTTTAQPDVDVDANVGVQPDGDLDVDADVNVDANTTTTTSTRATDATTHSTMSHTTATNMASAGDQIVQPSNSNPERDARGIPVISDPAVAPAGWNGAAGTGMGGPLIDATGQTATGADSSHPPCSRTVTDNCIQTYERGRSR